MSGYVGDLSDLQQQALDQLKDRIQDIWKEEFTDYFLLRWLRARDFDVSKAESMLRQNQKWRRENNIDSLLETFKIPEALKPFLSGGLCNHDRDGHPIFIVRMGNTDLRGLLRCLTKEQMLMVSLVYLEQCDAEARRQSEKLGRFVGTGTVLADYEHLSMSQVCSLEVIEFLRKLIGVYESNYPETLERCFIVNTPSFFPYAWKILRPFMSEKTAGKMQIFSYEGWKPVLFQYVDPSAIPVHWGGTLMGPGDDPECTHMIGRGGHVPEHLYLKNRSSDSEDSDTTTCILERGQNLDVPVKVEREGSVLRWKFQTGPGHEVGFGVTWSPTGDTIPTQEILQTTRVKCDLVPEIGELSCAKTGTYIFRFDNSFSWFTKKQISYALQVMNPEEAARIGHC
ncbi:SEC14-like protein 2 [Ixodes scapularis]